MIAVKEGAFQYEFPDRWQVEKFDETSFYRKTFQSFAGGSPAVDIIAFAPDNDEVWLIEAKDYRTSPRTKPIEWFDELAEKVRGTLAAILAGRANSGEPTQAFFAGAASKVRIRVILHLEQPTKHSKIFPQPVDPKSAVEKLRKTLRAVDPHAFVGNRSELNRRKHPWRILP